MSISPNCQRFQLTIPYLRNSEAKNLYVPATLSLCAHKPTLFLGKIIKLRGLTPLNQTDLICDIFLVDTD